MDGHTRCDRAYKFQRLQALEIARYRKHMQACAERPIELGHTGQDRAAWEVALKYPQIGLELQRNAQLIGAVLQARDLFCGRAMLEYQTTQTRHWR